MNALKNLVMTAMLLAVSYGAYVILHQPVTGPQMTSGDFEGAAAGEDGALAAPPVVELTPTAPPPGGAPARRPDAASGGRGESSQPPPSLADAPPAAPESPDGSPYPTVPEFQDVADRYGGGADGAPDEATGGAAEESAAAPPQGAPAQPVANANFEDVWKRAQAMLAEHRLGEVLLLLSPWYYDPTLSPEQYDRCVELLDQLAGTVIYSRQSILEPPYRIQAGDTLESIAQRHQVTAELLGKINGIAPDAPLTPGEEIKVLRGPFDAEVSRDRNELTLFLGRYYAGRFPITLGRNFPSGEGDYEVAERTLGHDYFDPRTGQAISSTDAQNPFGHYWIGLRGSQVTAGDNIGIHAHPPSLPDSGSGGIILNEEQVADLHAILSIGSQVRVHR